MTEQSNEKDRLETYFRRDGNAEYQQQTEDQFDEDISLFGGNAESSPPFRSFSQASTDTSRLKRSSELYADEGANMDDEDLNLFSNGEWEEEKGQKDPKNWF